MNPLRLDPTRTTTLRNRFGGECVARIEVIRKDMIQLLVKDDAFGLRGHKPAVIFNEDWRYHGEDKKLENLRSWLEERSGKTLQGSDWMSKYIKQAYGSGVKRAGGSKPRIMPFGMNADQAKGYQKGMFAEYMRQSFGGPVAEERVRAMALRTMSDMKGVSDQMNKRIVGTMVDGMINGLSPREIGTELNRVAGLSKKEARALARTEVIRGFNEGVLDGLANLGVSAVGVMVEWTTSGLGVTKKGNPSPCKKCAPLANLVLTIEEARGLLPRHPNCLCSFVPANIGEKSPKQIRDARRIRAAIRQSARGDKRWVGRKTKIASRRPETIGA